MSNKTDVRRTTLRRTTLRKTVLRAVCAGTVVTGLLAASGAAHAGPRPDGPPAGWREAVREAVAAGNPGVVSYARKGARSWQFAAGVADRATGEPAHPSDRWRIFSNTKSFVATVLLQLVGEGRMNLDDRVERWLPGVVQGNGNDGTAITVRQLLDNRSGIYDPTNDPAFYTDRGGRTPSEIVAAAMAHAPLFPPGQDQEYSNTNYLLAGMIIEAVTHRRADVEIQRRIIGPLRLTTTSFPISDSRIPGPHLHGYDLNYRDVTDFNPSGEWTAGAMVSTVADLARFDAALFGGRLLRPAQQRELLAAVDGLSVKQIPIPCGDTTVTVRLTDGGGPGFLSSSMTSTDATRQLILVTNVFDLARNQRDEMPIVDASEAALNAAVSVFCS